MIKTKKQMYVIIASFFMIVLLGTVTYAFFNYTRTGTANTIRVGRVAFTSGQTNTINLNNVFPITSGEAATDTDNTGEVIISISGDTTNTSGIEYVVLLEDVNNNTNTGKKVPIGLIITPEKTGELGTSNTNYFNNGVRGGNTSYYKVLANEVAKNQDYILVGYIRPGAAEINGTIGIKAFLDKDKILISDTYDGSESDNMGTPSSMAVGKTVFTTREWNAMQINGVSFKVRVQANEGIWVDEPLSRNDMINFDTAGTFTSQVKSSITEINFIRMTEEMINTHADLFDLSGTNGLVKAWIDGTKLYIASPGETYFPVDSNCLLSNFANATTMNFNNVNTSLVQNMSSMFLANTNLTNIDLSSFDTSNVTNMTGMFMGCNSLESIDISMLDTSSVTTMASMFASNHSLTYANLSGLGSNSLTNIGYIFQSCSSLETVNMSRFNFGTITSLQYGLTGGGSNSIVSLDLSNANTSNLTNMSFMFVEYTALVNLNLSGIDTSNVTNMSYMFYGCTSLVTLDLSSFDTSNVTNMERMFAMEKWQNNSYVPINNALTTIYVGNNWNVSSVSSSNNMFYNCTHLVGGNGTIYDSNYIDAGRAIIDSTNNQSGYLTLKTN